jgi:hypothetical protein
MNTVCVLSDKNALIKYSKLRLFADDSIIHREIKSHQDCQKLQHDLDAAAQWESDWLMACSIR